ncbi:MAG: winged helix-turn-helix domain-containing protein [Brachybacterium paraconglomeratum]|nr:winged helix-turn-helix domain-containing protein [Brachybacterium paraconglomeratum]
MTDIPDATSTSALRAMAHPLRLRMLSLLTGSAMSAAEVARELGISQANASYHLRVLARAGEVVEAGEEKVRGGVAKRYRHPWDAAEPMRRPDEGARRQQLRTMAAELERRGARRRPGGRNLTADAELWVTPDVRDRVLALLTEAATLLHAEAQPPRTEGTGPLNLTLVAFEMTDDSEAGAR